MTRNLRCPFLQTDADLDRRIPAARLDSLLLSSIGTLVAHQTAYSVASLLGQSTQVGHGHLGFVWKLSLLAGVIGMTGVVLRSLRSRNYKIANPVCTGVAVAASFTSMELLERLADGIAPSELATELVFWLGLAATVPITFVYTYILRTVSEVAGKFWGFRSAPEWPSIVCFAPDTKRSFGIGCFDHSWSIWSRGPPTLSVSALHS